MTKAPLDLTPKAGAFDEAWQAQTLAIAEAMIKAGYFSAQDWATTLGDELARAAAQERPDTLETYYGAALNALETLSTARTSLTQDELQQRKKAWVDAYRSTPHGEPVELES